MKPHLIETPSGVLRRIPQPLVEVCGKRFSVFGGGYLRLAPWSLIRRGIAHLERHGRSLIVYIHPREIDPDQPRLPLSCYQSFKCYVNLAGTYRKLKEPCSLVGYITMEQLGGWLFADGGSSPVNRKAMCQPMRFQ